MRLPTRVLLTSLLALAACLALPTTASAGELTGSVRGGPPCLVAPCLGEWSMAGVPISFARDRSGRVAKEIVVGAGGEFGVRLPPGEYWAFAFGDPALVLVAVDYTQPGTISLSSTFTSPKGPNPATVHLALT